jgi:hypothetical protein
VALDDTRLDPLLALIQDSFRVHPNKQPVYEETANNLSRISAQQHQVVFGRRGSGKSCLLVTHLFEPSVAGSISIYANADDFKKLSYPDMLVRILIRILAALPQRQGFLWLQQSLAAQRLVELRATLDEAEQRDVDRQRSAASSTEVGVSAFEGGAEGSVRRRSAREQIERSSFVANKVDYLERHKVDFRKAIVLGIKGARATHCALIVDDFYLVPLSLQPDVVDYLHSLVRGTNLYLKIGTIRHRTQLFRSAEGQTVGIVVRQDYEAIDLDQTFENVPRTRDILKRMFDSMGRKVQIDGASDLFMTADAQHRLALASGGVPRDYLNIFVDAVADASASGNRTRLTPKNVYRGAARDSYQTKRRNFREDAGTDYRPLEHLYNDLVRFCLIERRKTAFLISETEAQADPVGHELIRQLMDLKLIHVIEPDTSAASGRPGRYEAYTLDFATFMEPRKRNIEIVEFWKRDANSRPQGVREAPVYSLARARVAAEQLEDVAVSSDENEGTEGEQ